MKNTVCLSRIFSGPRRDWAIRNRNWLLILGGSFARFLAVVLIAVRITHRLLFVKMCFLLNENFLQSQRGRLLLDQVWLVLFCLMVLEGLGQPIQWWLAVFILIVSFLGQNLKDFIRYFHNFMCFLLARCHQIKVFGLSLVFLQNRKPRCLGRSQFRLGDGRIGMAITCLNNLFRN